MAAVARYVNRTGIRAVRPFLDLAVEAAKNGALIGAELLNMTTVTDRYARSDNGISGNVVQLDLAVHLVDIRFAGVWLSPESQEDILAVVCGKRIVVVMPITYASCKQIRISVNSVQRGKIGCVNNPKPVSARQHDLGTVGGPCRTEQHVFRRSLVGAYRNRTEEFYNPALRQFFRIQQVKIGYAGGFSVRFVGLIYRNQHF